MVHFVVFWLTFLSNRFQPTHDGFVKDFCHLFPFDFPLIVWFWEESLTSKSSFTLQSVFLYFKPIFLWRLILLAFPWSLINLLLLKVLTLFKHFDPSIAATIALKALSPSNPLVWNFSSKMTALFWLPFLILYVGYSSVFCNNLRSFF